MKKSSKISLEWMNEWKIGVDCDELQYIKAILHLGFSQFSSGKLILLEERCRVLVQEVQSLEKRMDNYCIKWHMQCWRGGILKKLKLHCSGKVHRGEDTRAGFWGMTRSLPHSNPIPCNCFHIFWLYLQQIHVLTPLTPPPILWDGYYYLAFMDSSRTPSAWPQNTWLVLLQKMQLFSYLINQTYDSWALDAWAVESQDVSCPSFEDGALAYSLRCSHPDEEDRSQMQSLESVPMYSLSCCQLTSAKGLPLHDPLKYVMLITSQLPVCPLSSLIPPSLDRYGNQGIWSLRWICGRARQEPRSPDCLPTKSQALGSKGPCCPHHAISPTPTDQHSVGTGEA